MKFSLFTIIIIDTITIYLFGVLIYRVYGVITALFLQFIPFLSHMYLTFLARLRPETFLTTAILIFTGIIVMYLNRDKFNIPEKKYLYLFALIIGFGIGLKIYFVPFTLVPLIIIHEKRNKLRFLLYTLISFIIFGFPVLFRLEKFYKWIRKLITHSGIYGSGEKNVVEPDKFLDNLGLLYKKYTEFFWIQILSIFIILVFIYVIKKKYNVNRLAFKTLYAITIAFTFFVILVTKHFKLHYMLPVHMLFIFQLFLIFLLIKDIMPLKLFNILSPLFFLYVIFYFVSSRSNDYIHYCKANKSELKALGQTENHLKKNRNEAPFFIYGDGYGDPYVERAINFGYVWAGNRNRGDYIEAIKKIYPNFYQYTRYDGKFSFWYEPLDTNKLVSNYHKGALLFIGNDQDTITQYIVKQIHDIYKMDIKIDTLFRNEKMKEAIYRLDFVKEEKL